MAGVSLLDYLSFNSTTESPSLTTMPDTNTTSMPDPSRPYPEYVGYIAAIVAVVMYGSNFVPIKKFYTGDGMFFQWILCCGIFMVGVIIQIVRQSEFHRLVMVGGFIWTTGNLCVVPIFKTIGMGLGMSTWSTFGLIMGWAAGRFGFFGTVPDVITNSGMNYAGVALAFGSIVLYVMVKNEIGGPVADLEIIVNHEETDPLIPRTATVNGFHSRPPQSYSNGADAVIANKSTNSAYTRGDSSSSQIADDRLFIEDLSPIKKRIIGTALSVISGILYGIQFSPCIYVQDNYPNASKNGLDYVFAQFSGIFASSCVYFFIYCAIKKNKPKIYPQTILPGIISGMMWAIATSCWFIANAEISEAVSYPIVSTAPAAIASLFWGVFIFREIQGKRNIIILLLAFCIMSAGAVLAGLSK